MRTVAVERSLTKPLSNKDRRREHVRIELPRRKKSQVTSADLIGCSADRPQQWNQPKTKLRSETVKIRKEQNRKSSFRKTMVTESILPQQANLQLMSQEKEAAMEEKNGYLPP